MQCPLLSLVYQEVLRTKKYYSIAGCVLEDTLLAGEYLLKGNTILIVNSIIHASASTQGSTATETDFYRLVPGKGSALM